MEANTGNRACPHWRALYEAAVLEINANRLPQRIAEAQSAIMDQIEDLNHSCDGSESQALMDALNVLRDLRKMLAADGQAENYNVSDKLSSPPTPSQTHVSKKES